MRKLAILLFILVGGILIFNYRSDDSSPSSMEPQATTTSLVSEKPLPREVSITVAPLDLIQGEPALISVENLSGTATVKALSFNGKNLGLFGNSALLGIDLRMAAGSYPLVATLSDGRTVKANLTVGKRTLVEAPLGIPESLGGNTPQAEQELVNTLAQEGAIINAIPTSPAKLWSGAFRYPLDGEITITDTYGYSRLTGATTIAHKGTDFRAATGTPVYAMNAGKVAYVGFLRNYGNVIAIDHGLGLLTIYMHLSEVVAPKGKLVEKGELIAKSGATGYVLGPHLHLSVRINNISIDPMKFMALMGEK